MSDVTVTISDVRLDEWQAYVHRWARDKGWWEEERNFGEMLMLVVSEAAEALEEWRHGHALDEVYEGEGGKPEGIPTELADIVIRVMDICERYGISLEREIARKMAYNETRPYRHGQKRA